MSRYLWYIEQNEKWRGVKPERHVLDKFNEAYSIIYDTDDYIPDPDALSQFAIAADKGDYDLIYCDEDVVRDHERTRPYFKPGYSPENERSLGYISGMIAVKKGREEDALYSFERDKVCHIEKALYHRIRERAVPDRVKTDPFFDKFHGKISVILLSKDNPDMLSRCVKTVRASLLTDDCELILVDNGSEDGAKHRYEEICSEQGISYYYEPSDFNYSELNNYGASRAHGDILIFMNDDIEVPESEKGVLERMASRASQDDAGAVGIKLLYPNEDRIQHCGIVLLHTGPSHKLQGYRDDVYYYGYSDHDINALAVTGACLAVRRDRFESVSGFDEKLPVAYNDVDLSMRLYEKGYNNVCMNSHHLIHYEGATRKDDRKNRGAYERLKRERVYFISKHGELVDAGDPYMNKNLSPYSLDFDINLPYEWELAGMSHVSALYKKAKSKKRMHGSLDSIEYHLSDAYGNEDYYEALGWVFREGRGKLAPCLILECDGKRYAAEAFPMRRTDVGDVFPKFKKSVDSGFIARISAGEMERLGIHGEVTAYPALLSKRRRIYKGDEECQRKIEI